MPASKRRAGSMDEPTSTSRKKQHVRRLGDGSSEPAVKPDVKVKEEVSTSSGPGTSAGLTGYAKEAHEAMTMFQTSFESLRGSLTCRICERLFYEPYVLSCGHTYCYQCLSKWFNESHKKTCPNCRVDITQLPAPSYAIKEMVEVIVRRSELLPDGESKEEHATWKKEEADFLAAERDNTDPRRGGLFRGRFNQRSRLAALGPLHDSADGIARCPECHWELEDDRCEHCNINYGDASDSMSDDYDSLLEDDLDAIDNDFDPQDSEMMWYDNELSPGSYRGGPYPDRPEDPEETARRIREIRNATVMSGFRNHHHMAHHNGAHAAALVGNGQMGRRPGSPRPPFPARGFPLGPEFPGDERWLHDYMDHAHGRGSSYDSDTGEDEDSEHEMDDFIDDEPIEISSDDEPEEGPYHDDGSTAQRLDAASVRAVNQQAARGGLDRPLEYARRTGRRRVIDDDDDDDEEDDDENSHDVVQQHSGDSGDSDSESSSDDSTETEHDHRPVVQNHHMPSSPSQSDSDSTSDSDDERDSDSESSEEEEEDIRPPPRRMPVRRPHHPSQAMVGHPFGDTRRSRAPIVDLTSPMPRQVR